MSFKVYLRDVAEFQKGFAFKSKDYVDKGIKIVKVSNLTADSIDISQCVCIENNFAKKYITKYDLNTKDIIITTVGSWPTNPASVVGKVVRVPKTAENTLLNQNAVRVRGNERVVQDYLYYLLKDKNFMSYIVGTAQGSANQASITQEDIKNFSFYLPSLVEQKAIANILLSLDDKIELNNQMNETLEEMAQALFKRWFVDFEFPNEEGQPYKSSGGQMIESELGMIPKGWEVLKAQDYYNITIGKTPPRKEPHWFSNNNEDVKWISISDLGVNGTFVTKTNEFLTEDAVKKHNIQRVPTGTVVLSFKLTVGRVAITTEDMVTNEAIAHFKNQDSSLREYTYFYLKNFNYESLGNTSSIAKAVNSKIIKSMPILIPNKVIIEKYHSIVFSIFEKMKDNKYNNETLMELRDTLLPKLMSGEIRVSDLC